MTGAVRRLFSKLRCSRLVHRHSSAGTLESKLFSALSNLKLVRAPTPVSAASRLDPTASSSSAGSSLTAAGSACARKRPSESSRAFDTVGTEKKITLPELGGWSVSLPTPSSWGRWGTPRL
eukprot:5912541-Pyramimonas_sp.AAC.1